MLPSAEEISADYNLGGKTYLVTGSNSGIGFETARVLALRGAHVVCAARTIEKAEDTCARIEGETTPLAFELSDLAGIRHALSAFDIPLDGIVANAGIMALPELSATKGIETQMYVNHVGHSAVVLSLLPHLKDNGRVVMLSSGAHAYAAEGVTFESLAWQGEYTPWSAYGNSKLANILFAKALTSRLKDGQTANALHPGVIETPLFKHIPQPNMDQMKTNMSWRTVPQGAATTVYVAGNPELKGISGKYFADCAEKTPSAAAQNTDLAETLWKSTLAFLGDEGFEFGG